MMTPEQFCVWLQGVMDGVNNSTMIGCEIVSKIRANLSKVTISTPVPVKVSEDELAALKRINESMVEITRVRGQ